MKPRRTIPLLSLAVATAILSQPVATATAAATSEDRGRTPADGPSAPALAGGIIVKTRGDGGVAAVREAVGDRVDGRVTSAPVLAGVTSLRTDGIIALDEARALAAEIARRPDVVWAHPDTLMQVDEDTDVAPPTAVNDPLYGSLYNLWDARDATSPEVAAVAPSAWPAGGYGVKAPALWQSTRGAGSVVVAVIDTGYRPHPDLAPNLVAGYDTIADLPTSRDGDGRDADASDPGDYVTPGYSCYQGTPADNSSWHGTHVAGTVAAAADNVLGVAGVAPGVKVQPIRALGVCGGFLSDIAAGIEWASGGAVAGLPANATPARVINMSLGGTGTCSPTYQTAIDSARSRGAVVVVSAGNDNGDTATKQPASCAGVVNVGSTSEYGDKASYSNYGSLVDVSAPGGDDGWNGRSILSTYNAGTTVPGADTYAELQGTSMAAPAVAGSAALLLSLGAFSPDQAETALKTAVAPFPSSANGLWAQCAVGVCGAGILDLGLVPAPVSAPVITGSARAGARLTATPGSWIGPAQTLSYEWLLDGTVVGSSSTYVVDEPGSIVLRVAPAAGSFTPIARDSAPVSTSGKKSKIKLTAPDRVRKGVKFRVTVKVKVKGTKKPKGKITIYDGKRKVGKAKLKKSKKGKLTFLLKKPLKGAGKHKLMAHFDGKIGVFDSDSRKQKVKVIKP